MRNGLLIIAGLALAGFIVISVVLPQMAGGEIVRDFLTRFLGDRIDHGIVASRRENLSLSAEAILALNRLRGVASADRDWQFDPLAARLEKRMRHLGPEWLGGRPVALCPDYRRGGSARLDRLPLAARPLRAGLSRDRL